MGTLNWIDEPAWKGGLHLELLGGRQNFYNQSWAGNQVYCDDFSRLYVIKSGQAYSEVKDVKIPLVPGSLYFFPAGHAARFGSHGNFELLWLHFRMELIPGIELFHRWTPPTSIPLTEEADYRMTALVSQISETENPRIFLRLCADLSVLVLPFLPDNWSVLIPSSDRLAQLQPALDYIRKHLERPITLAELAATVGLHPNWFANIFTSVLSIAPIRYILKMRLRKAVRLLCNTDTPIGQIARECGFTDAFYFSRIFREHIGCSPRTYRTTHGAPRPMEKSSLDEEEES